MNNVAIVFLVVAHRDPEQVHRLLASLAHPRCLTLLHVDSKSLARFSDHLDRLRRDGGKVQVLPSTAVTWGGLTQVQLVLRALDWLRDHDVGYGHVAHVSGQCFPLRPVGDMVERLGDAPGTSFFRMRHLRTEWPRAMRRIRWLHWEVPVGRRRVIGLPVPMRARYPTFEWYGGSCWFWLARDAGMRLLDDPFSHWLLRRLRFCNSPDEIFYQTALRHLLPPSALYQDNLRFEEWEPDPQRPNRFLPNPKTLGIEDLPALEDAAANGALFARKFPYQPGLYDALERRLREPKALNRAPID